MTGNKGDGAKGCAAILALFACGLLVLFCCARVVGCGLGIV